MPMPLHLAAICITALTLTACSKTPANPLAPPLKPAQIEAGPSTGTAADPSVPPANSVITPANETKPDPAAGRSNKAMSQAQESSAMPMPGQSNDHSAPLTPAKRASGP